MPRAPKCHRARSDVSFKATSDASSRGALARAALLFLRRNSAAAARPSPSPVRLINGAAIQDEGRFVFLARLAHVRVSLAAFLLVNPGLTARRRIRLFFPRRQVKHSAANYARLLVPDQTSTPSGATFPLLLSLSFLLSVALPRFIDVLSVSLRGG